MRSVQLKHAGTGCQNPVRKNFALGKAGEETRGEGRVADGMTSHREASEVMRLSTYPTRIGSNDWLQLKRPSAVWPLWSWPSKDWGRAMASIRANIIYSREIEIKS